MGSKSLAEFDHWTPLFWPALCDEPNCGLVGFPLFCWHLGCFGVWEPKFTIYLIFDPQNGHFYTPETLRFKGKCPIFREGGNRDLVMGF